MDIFWIRALSQLGIYATFGLYLAVSMRRGARDTVPLLGTVVYAVVFEHFNMLRYAHTRGGYYYHPASWLFLWQDVPLYIPLAWAFIVATSRALTDEIITRGWAKPFCDALLALLIDLSLDVIAIRLHFWTWRGVRWNQGFFGVPADNFLGWLLVTFTFSALTRALWRAPTISKRDMGSRAAVQMLIVPICAYGLYLALEAVVHGGYRLLGANTLEQQFGVLGGVLLVFLAAAIIGSKPDAAMSAENGKRSASSARWRHVPLHGPRHIFHVFALVGFFCLPLAVRGRGVLAVTFAVWLVELFVAWRVSKRLSGTEAKEKT